VNTPFKTLSEMIGLTSPFPEGEAVKAWKAAGKRVIGHLYLAVPEELIHAGGFLPFRMSGDNEPLPMQLAESYVLFNQCGVTKGVWQQILEKKYDFLDGSVHSNVCDGVRRIYDNCVEFKPTPFMDVLNFPRKANEDAVQVYLVDLELLRDRLSTLRGQRIRDIELKRSIEIYNHTRELMKQFYELRKRDRPPVTGTETLEMMKAAGRMPRETYNDLLEKLLKEIKSSGREVKKGKRLMIVGNDIHNSNWMAAIEELDAVVVTDEMNVGTRYFAGKVDASLPPMEGLARHYILGRPQEAMTFGGNRFEHILKTAKEYKVDGVISENVRYCAPVGNDKPWLRKELEKHGVQLMELDMEYGEKPSGQIQLRTEAFVEMLQS